MINKRNIFAATIFFVLLCGSYVIAEEAALESDITADQAILSAPSDSLSSVVQVSSPPLFATKPLTLEPGKSFADKEGTSKAVDALTVTDVVVDKTAKNAVIARTQAITEAKRLAFQQLAERHLPPADFEVFELPEDSVISTLVKDFEITSEQLSLTRYVANFTVRFRKEVGNYIDLEDVAGIDKILKVLVLPYYETPEGQSLLWDENNAWLTAWQTGQTRIPGISVVVPLGDITDMATGPADHIWRGEYTVLEALAGKYRVDVVIPAVLNAAGFTTAVDIYSYANGVLSDKESFVVYGNAEEQETTFRHAVAQVNRFLYQLAQKQKEYQPSLTTAAGEEAAAQYGLVIDAEMHFTQFSEWVEAQKRLMAAMPSVKMELKELTNEGARFSLKFGGDAAGLQMALADQNLALARVPERGVYDLELKAP